MILPEQLDKVIERNLSLTILKGNQMVQKNLEMFLPEQLDKVLERNLSTTILKGNQMV